MPPAGIPGQGGRGPIRVAAPSVGPKSYSTTYPVGEFSNGLWRLGAADGIDWTDPTRGTANGGPRMWGTQLGGPSSGPPYNDSLGVLSGYALDHEAINTIDLNVGGDVGFYHEAECLVRFSISANVARGYEFNHAWNGAYAGWVRWNGVLNDYNGFSGGGATFGALTAGSKIKTQAVGDVLTAWVDYNDGNGYRLSHQVNIRTGTVDAGPATGGGSASSLAWDDGNPGVGMWLRGGSTLPPLLMSSQFSARDL